jgi:uncharacterized protein with PIN domain
VTIPEAAYIGAEMTRKKIMMTCPSCKGELSKIWQPQPSSDAFHMPPEQWRCGTCGQTFSKEQLQYPKRRVRAKTR